MARVASHAFWRTRNSRWAPRKIGPTRRTPQNCLQMIPLRSRSDSLTFTPRLSVIGSETNFSRSPKEISPGLARLAVLWSGNNASHRLQLKEMETAIPVLGLRLQSVPVRDAGELDAGFQAAVQAGIQAVVTMDDQLIKLLRVRIVDLATRRKRPVMGEFRPMTA